MRDLTADLPGKRRSPAGVVLPADGTFPLGTAKYEKRNLALEIPVWDAELCTQCGKCPFVCPHSAIRASAFSADVREGCAADLQARAGEQQGIPAGTHISYQVAPEDCTGCDDCAWTSARSTTSRTLRTRR